MTPGTFSVGHHDTGYTPMGEDRHFMRLTECVKHSRTRTQPYRELNQMLVDSAMGQYYPRVTTKEQDIPINHMWLTHRAMSRWLYLRNPRAIAQTSVTPWKSFAEDAEIALNRTIEESDFGTTLSEVVDQSLYSVGALCMTADYVGTDDGMQQKLCLESVPFPDLIWDPECRVMQKSDYLGRVIYQKLIDVREHPLYDEAARKQVQSTNDDMRSDNERANFQAQHGHRSQLYDYVKLYQVRDRSDDRIYVWPVDQPNLKLMGEKWNGPPDGFIRLLHYGAPPGHPYPVSPMQNVYRLARASNILLTKALQQQQTAKGLLLYTAAQKDEAKDIVESQDLQSVLQEHGALRWTHVGGASQDTVAMSEHARKLFGTASGASLDQLLGLSPGAPTLGQERLLGEATTANMQDMAEYVQKFVRAAVRDAYWFNVRSPEGSDVLWKPIGRTGLQYDVPWTPEKRNAIKQMNFAIDVEPYSYRARTPDGRLADFLSSLQILGQWAPQMAAQGIMFDMESIVRTISKYKDLQELYDALIMNQDPERLAQLMGPRPGQTPMQMAGPNGRYVRESRSDGAGKEQELLRMFSKAGQQNAEAA